MKISEIRTKSKLDLENLLINKREEARRIRFDIASHKIKDVKALNKIKREIAKILTILKEKEE